MRSKQICSLALALIMLFALLPLNIIEADAAATLLWPVPGHFSLSRGYSSSHGAMDINDSNISGANIVAAIGGKVVRVSKCTKQHYQQDCSCGGTGTGIVIKGTDNRYYSYAHMKAGSIPSDFVANKTTVSAGDFIGKVGTTGNSSGPHLHFSIATGSNYLDNRIDPEYETYTNVGATAFSFSALPSKTSVSDTDAVVAVSLKKPAYNRLIKYGVTIYNQNGVAIGSVSSASSGQKGVQNVSLWYTISSSIGLTLMPGTTYQYAFWSNVSGVTLYSAKYSFTTTGTASYNVECYANHSGKNYFQGSDFKNGLDTTLYKSRNTSIYQIAVDSTVKRVDSCNTLKVVGASAGNSSSNDMAFTLNISGSRDYQNYVGNDSVMTLSFWAKSSVNGAKMYIRWGWEPVSELKNVTLTTDWQYYTVTMPRQKIFGNNLHPYFDTAGTFWLSELQMEDGDSASAFVAENGNKTSVTAKSGQKYSALTTPERDGYTFDGWYTSATGGTRISASDAVQAGHLVLYAHWISNTPPVDPPVEPPVEPPVTSEQLGDVNLDGAINQYDYILVKRHYFGTRYLTDDEMTRADVNYDGNVNQYDYILIKRHYFGTYKIG